MTNSGDEFTLNNIRMTESRISEYGTQITLVVMGRGKEADEAIKCLPYLRRGLFQVTFKRDDL